MLLALIVLMQKQRKGVVFELFFFFQSALDAINQNCFPLMWNLVRELVGEVEAGPALPSTHSGQQQLSCVPKTGRCASG